MANWPTTNALRSIMPLPEVVYFPFKTRMGLKEEQYKCRIKT